MLNVLRCQVTFWGQVVTNAKARFNDSLRPLKPEGSLGQTAQDVHLDSHTAPELRQSSGDKRVSLQWPNELWQRLEEGQCRKATLGVRLPQGQRTCSLFLHCCPQSCGCLQTGRHARPVTLAVVAFVGCTSITPRTNKCVVVVN